METEGKETVAKEEVSQETTLKAETPTAEEMKTLQAQLKDAESQKQKIEESYKGLQRTLNKTNEELKSQANMKAEIEALRDTQEILAAAIVSGARTEEDIASIPQEKKQDIIAQLKKAREDAKTRVEQERLNAKGQEYYQKTLASGITEKNIEFYHIRDAVVKGEFNKADAILAEMEAKKVTTDSTPKETEEERINRLVDERIQKINREKGVLKTDNASPGGSTKDYKQIRDAYIADPNNRKLRNDFIKAREARGE